MGFIENFKQFTKFCIVGVSNTVITIATYSILVYLGVNFIVANIIGYSIGIINSYIWNSKYVFNLSKSNYKVMIKFFCVNIFVLIINTLLLYILVEAILWNKYYSQLITATLGLFINYIFNKIWAFK